MKFILLFTLGMFFGSNALETSTFTNSSGVFELCIQNEDWPGTCTYTISGSKGTVSKTASNCALAKSRAREAYDALDIP